MGGGVGWVGVGILLSLSCSPHNTIFKGFVGSRPTGQVSVRLPSGRSRGGVQIKDSHRNLNLVPPNTQTFNNQLLTQDQIDIINYVPAVLQISPTIYEFVVVSLDDT